MEKSNREIILGIYDCVGNLVAYKADKYWKFTSDRDEALKLEEGELDPNDPRKVNTVWAFGNHLRIFGRERVEFEEMVKTWDEKGTFYIVAEDFNAREGEAGLAGYVFEWGNMGFCMKTDLELKF